MFHQNLSQPRVFSRQLSKDLLYDPSLASFAAPTTYYTRSRVFSSDNPSSILSRPRPGRSRSNSFAEDDEILEENEVAPLRLPSDTSRALCRLSGSTTTAPSARFPSTTTLSMVPNEMMDIDSKGTYQTSHHAEFHEEPVEPVPSEHDGSIATPVMTPGQFSMLSESPRENLNTSPPATAYSHSNVSTPLIYDSMTTPTIHILSATTLSAPSIISSKRKRTDSRIPVEPVEEVKKRRLDRLRSAMKRENLKGVMRKLTCYH